MSLDWTLIGTPLRFPWALWRDRMSTLSPRSTIRSASTRTFSHERPLNDGRPHVIDATPLPRLAYEAADAHELDLWVELVPRAEVATLPVDVERLHQFHVRRSHRPQYPATARATCCGSNRQSAARCRIGDEGEANDH
jgi:hypothetical protein